MFRELLEAHPLSVSAHTGLGLALIERDDWEEARELLERAVALNPDSAVAYSALGVSLDRLGRQAEAREAYLRATALQPHSKPDELAYNQAPSEQHQNHAKNHFEADFAHTV